MTSKGMRHINNGEVHLMIKSDDPLPDGFTYGMLPITERQRTHMSESHRGKKLSKESIEKRQKTFKEKYKVSSCSQLPGVNEKISQSLKSKEVQEKMKQTCIERYGETSVLAVPHIAEKMRQTNFKRHGDRNYNNKDKEYETRRKNNTLGLFETSPEKKLYSLLCLEYGKENVIKQYRTKEYPFKADFYISCLNCYIEYNGFWTHGGRPYDPNDIECQEKLKIWQEKNYKNAIYTWTDLDVRKRSYKDKINLVIFYPNKHDDIVYSFKKLKAELDSYKK